MSELAICMCGAQSGYPHKWDCPFPYYGHDDRLCWRWIEEREAIRSMGVKTPPAPQEVRDV